ncbi:hypothetical protein RB195_013092 [Necator americanus]
MQRQTFSAAIKPEAFPCSVLDAICEGIRVAKLLPDLPFRLSVEEGLLGFLWDCIMKLKPTEWWSESNVTSQTALNFWVSDCGMFAVRTWSN